MQFLQKNTLIYVLGPLGIVLLIFLAFNANRTPQNVIWTDMEGYYLYLPANFIYGGFKKEAVRDTNYLRPWPGTSTIYTKYTCGVAMLESPFFLTAHLLSAPLGYPSDGHSLIYCYALMLAAIFYMLAGSYLLWRSIRKYYSSPAAWIAVISLFFGTNMYYYTFFQPSMSHIYSFFLFSGLVYLTEKLLEPGPRGRDFVLFGLCSGLMVLTRPTSVVVLLYPLYRWIKQYPDKAGFLRRNRFHLVWMAVAGLMIWIPQVVYWKTVTGHWMMWSYGDETFKYWKEPKLFRVLFDAWNGWLLYSPIAFIPLMALFLGRHSNRHSERIILFILAVATYLFASWWAWWFGGAFGHRCYVEYYALLGIPFAGLIDRVLTRKSWNIAFLLLLLLLIYYNLGLTYNYRAPWDGADWTYDSVWREVKRLF